MRLNMELLNACPVRDLPLSETPAQFQDFEIATGEYGLVKRGDCGSDSTSRRQLGSELAAFHLNRATTDSNKKQIALFRRLREYAVASYPARALGPMLKPQHQPFSGLGFGCGNGVLARGI